MRTPNAQIIYDAANLVSGADHLLANTRFESQLSAKDCYDLAEKLERARNLLLVAGDRKYQTELNQIPLPEGVPF
jgi:hypothetical protein